MIIALKPKVYFRFAIPIVLIVTAIVLFILLSGRHDAAKTTASTDGQITHITGKLTYIRNDCVPGSRLDASGQVIKDTNATCDAGSFISVGDTLIQFSSGNVVPSAAFSKSIDGFSLGDSVKATYIKDGTFNSFNCSSCGLTKN